MQGEGFPALQGVSCRYRDRGGEGRRIEQVAGAAAAAPVSGLAVGSGALAQDGVRSSECPALEKNREVDSGTDLRHRPSSRLESGSHAPRKKLPRVQHVSVTFA